MGTGLAMVFAMAAVPAIAADKIVYAPDEAWVKPVSIPKPDDAYAGAPAQVLLQDLQVNFAADGAATYHTVIAYHIQTPAGLQNAQSYITWNPETDLATVHKVQILRGDQVIDVLAKGQTFTILRREQNLDRAMLDGQLTGVLQPEGLQPGDTLVFSMSVERKDPVWAGRGELVIGGLSQGAIGQQSVRAVWDPAKPVHWRQSEDLGGKAIKAGGLDGYEMQRSHVVKAETQDDAPARFNQFGQIEFSQFGSWQELSSVLAPLYIKAAKIAPDSPLQAEIETIRKTTSDKKAQAAMALRLVENQVRYVFLGMDLGGYTPAGADATWQRRFGDCKGKSVLLAAILNALDIKAEPALVNSGGGDGLDQRLPAMEQFDHVIVRAEIAGKIYWLDGTRLGDRDLDSVRAPDLRWALPVRDGGATLEAIPMKPLDKPSEDTFIRLDASAGLDVPAAVHIEKTYRGDFAVQFDAAYRALPDAERDKTLKGFWTSDYSWMTPRKVTAAFDAATGEERLVMDGTANMEWTAGDDGLTWRYETDIMNVGWSYESKRDSGPHRDAPVIINFPYYERTREEIVLPKDAKGFSLEGAPVDKTLGGAVFHRSVVLKDNVVTLESSKQALVPEISFKDEAAAAPVLTDLWKQDVYLIAPKRYHKAAETAKKATPAAATTTAAADAPKTAADYAAEGQTAFRQNRLDEAMSQVNKALRLDPENVQALTIRGMVFVSRYNWEAAGADFELATKIDPSQRMALEGLGQVRLVQGRYDDAVDAANKALAIYPNDLYGLTNRANAYLYQGKTDLARKDAEAARDLDPDASNVILVLVEVDVRDGKVEEARDLLRHGLVNEPDNIGLHRRLAELYENCSGLDADKCAASKVQAVGEWDKVIAARPSAYAYAMRAQDRPKSDRQQKLDDIDAAIKLEPKNEIPLLVRAALWLSEKNYDKAMEDADAATALSPKDEQTLSIRAKVYLAQGKTDKALAEYDAIKAANPRSPSVFNSSCWTRATHNIQLDTALADCNTAVSLAPKAAAYLDSRGFVNLRLGRLDDARKDYDAALAIVPDLPASMYGRGLVRLRKGDKAGGQADLAAARKVFSAVDAEFASYGVKP
jgi:tetratricopeptide (TPR) repeat protein